MAKTIAELRAMSDDELIEQYDKLAGRTQVGTGFYLAELERRQADRQNRLMIGLTVAIAALTVVNVVALIFG